MAHYWWSEVNKKRTYALLMSPQMMKYLQSVRQAKRSQIYENKPTNPFWREDIATRHKNLWTNLSIAWIPINHKSNIVMNRGTRNQKKRSKRMKGNKSSEKRNVKSSRSVGAVKLEKMLVESRNTDFHFYCCPLWRITKCVFALEKVRILDQANT